MSSSWNHPICKTCWDAQNPGRPAVAVVNSETYSCCFCGQSTAGGIFVRKDPRTLDCNGVHESRITNHESPK